MATFDAVVMGNMAQELAGIESTPAVDLTMSRARVVSFVITLLLVLIGLPRELA